MRPDLVTIPLPVISGSATVPSTADLLINGRQIFSQQIEAGPFEIPQVPMMSGAGNISLALTDALGRQVITTLPFYSSAALLAPGLQVFSAEAGAIRRNWGLLSNDYRTLAGTASYRRGLTPWLTVEAAAEATSGVAMLGDGVVVNVRNLLVLEMAYAASGGSERPGQKVSVGVQRAGNRLSVGASVAVSDAAFRDVAAVNGDPSPRLQLSMNANLALGQGGSIGIAFTEVDRDAPPNPVRLYLPPGRTPPEDTFLVNSAVYFRPSQHARAASLSYVAEAGGVSFFASGFHDFANKGSTGVLLGITIPINGRSSASASLGTSGRGAESQVQAQQAAVVPGDWGYQVYGDGANPARGFAQVQYQSPYALLSAGVDRTGGTPSVRLGGTGSVSLVDGALFASNAISDSFAVVDTGGLANVRVLQENRNVGVTDSAGRLLLTDLRSFGVNHLAIDPLDVAPDTTIPVTTRDVRPQDRSGIVVRFPVKVSHAALLRLADETGAPLPVGSTATLQATATTVPIGYDGEAYVPDLDQHNVLLVERPDGRRCRVAFDYRPVAGDIPRISPSPCRIRTSP